MTRKTILIFSLTLALSLTAGAAAYWVAAQDTRDETPVTETATRERDGDSTSSDQGRAIVISRWNMAFNLPERIDVTDTRLVFKTYDRFDVAVVASKTLEENINRDMCWGGTLQLGSFVEILRSKEQSADNDRTKIGDYYYKVDEGPGYETCYDKSLFDNYYGQDVVPSVASSLRTN